MKNLLKSAAVAIALTGFAGPALAQTPADSSYIVADYALSAEDDLAIRQIVTRLNHAVDVGDYEVYATFFSDDAVFDTAFGQAIGPEQISAALEQSRPYISGKRHVASNILISGDGETATATSYLIVFEATTGLDLVGTAVNVDTLEKRDGEWIVVRHETELDPATLAAMQAAMSAGAEQ